jgi:cyanate permease
MALPPLLTRSEDVHRLSAAMFAIGYLCAFVIPIIGGVIWDATAFAPAAFGPIVLFAGLAVMLAARLEFKPGSDPVFR